MIPVLLQPHWSTPSTTHKTPWLLYCSGSMVWCQTIWNWPMSVYLFSNPASPAHSRLRIAHSHCAWHGRWRSVPNLVRRDEETKLSGLWLSTADCVNWWEHMNMPINTVIFAKLYVQPQHSFIYVTRKLAGHTKYTLLKLNVSTL